MGALPRILFAWELGAHFGHASKIAETARALAGRADIWVAARDPVGFRAIAPDLPVRLIAAPAAAPRPPVSAEDQAVSYPDDLRHVGWAEAAPLAALIEAWESLFELIRPEIMVAQAAPTALLAARGLDLITAMVGGGYDAPPSAAPMPPFYFWRAELHAKAAARETAVLATANGALALRGKPQLTQFSDALKADHAFLATFAEIDHYGDRSRFEPDHPPYLGQLVTLDQGAELEWRPGAARRILAYLRPGGPAFDAAAGALAALAADHDVILAAPGAQPALFERMKGTPVRLVNGPVRLDRLLPDCDLGVSHGSNGVAAAFLLSGLPQICLPTHAEQVMVARAIGEGGFGLGLVGRFGEAQVGAAIRQALGSAPLRGRVRAAAARIGASAGRSPGARIADALMAVVQGRLQAPPKR
ncbi:MAG: nucleotide disphospho-sugar-binding domain-containing protein [Paracoccaceae bacterium]